MTLDNWARISGVADRARRLESTYNRSRTDRGLPPRIITPKFMFLHTLAHVLMKQLAIECGYGSAALRERIYCDLPDSPPSMQGILIYTASGDSEGTLGGLVRQGEPGRLERTVSEGIHNVRWCSSDPVCIESHGQGVDNCNLAACHGCVLVSETSCEEGNRLLDRAAVIGTLEYPGIGMYGLP